MTPDLMPLAVRLLEMLRAARFFMESPEAAEAMPGTAAALVAVAENMAGDLTDELDAVEAAA